MSPGTARRKALLSGTMLVAMVAGYGRRAYAACVNTGGSTFECSGTNVVQQNITANDATVSTVPGFSVTTANPYGIRIRGDGALSYTDTNTSGLTASQYGLYLAAANNNGGTPGSVTVNTNGAISGDGGLFAFARNGTTGGVNLTLNGNVTANTRYGISTRGYGSGVTLTTGAGTTVSTVSGSFGIYAGNSGAGTGASTITINGDVTAGGATSTGLQANNGGSGGLSLTTAAGTTVSGGNYGISASNSAGAATIILDGNVTGNSYSGINVYNSVTATSLSLTTGVGSTVSGGGSYGAIYARNFGSGAFTISTGANSTVTGASRGIFALNAGTNELAITANGDVTGMSGNGIDARNNSTGTNLTVTTGASTTVSGGSNGIYAVNQGTGTTTVTASGDVTGTAGRGIDAKNSSAGNGISVSTAAGTAVSGATEGIAARNYGAGTTIVTANGDVTSTSTIGILARNVSSSTDITVTTGAGTTVRGRYSGIYASNAGTGALTVTANGDVTGTNGIGISAYSANAGTTLSVTTAAGTVVSGTTYGILSGSFGSGAQTVTANGIVTGSTGIRINGGVGTVTVGGAGVVTGSGGTAIQFVLGANRLDLVTGATINGNVLGGSGTDTLGLSGTSSGNFNVGQLSSFETGGKTGTGTWTLTGNNAAITTFSVGGGTLAVNGSLANAAMTVNSGSTLGGTGTIGNTSIIGGTFRPGSGTAGTSMNVNGTLGFNSASTFAVNVNPTASSSATVSGAATLGNATVNAIFANGSYIARQYTILTAGSISGAFGTLTNTNLPANFINSLSYDATHAYLNLSLSFIAPPTSGLNGNQQNVGNALINYFNTNGGIPLVYGGLTANGLSQASGQPGASTSQSGISSAGQFANAIFDAAFDDNSGQGGASGFAQSADEEASFYAPKKKLSREATDAYAAVTPRDRRVPTFEQRWNVWASVYGGNSRVSGDAGAGTSTTTSRIFGTAVGATYRATPNTQLGFALGGAGTNFSLDGGFGGGKADVFNAAVYARHNFGAAYVAGLLGYSWQDTTTDRTVTIAGTDQLRATFKAQALTARLESGWRYATPALGITPYAALQSTSFYLPSYGETIVSGTGTFALNYASKTITATRSEVGAKFDKAMLVQNGVFTLRAKAAWAHDWNTDRAATATFQALPGATFTVNGAQPSASAALLSVGAEMKWHNGWSLAGSFDGEFSRTTASYAGKGSVKYAW